MPDVTIDLAKKKTAVCEQMFVGSRHYYFSVFCFVPDHQINNKNVSLEKKIFFFYL